MNFRSVQLFYDGTTSYNGINAYRYSNGENFLNQFSDCFCIDKIKGALTDDNGCLYPGALDLSECLGKKNGQKTSMSGCWLVIFPSDAPVVASMPHFLNADKRYNFLVDGLYANEEKHNIFIDIEPHTGTPLRGGKKLQFNMFLKKIDQISMFWELLEAFELLRLNISSLRVEKLSEPWNLKKLSKARKILKAQKILRI